MCGRVTVEHTSPPPSPVLACEQVLFGGGGRGGGNRVSAFLAYQQCLVSPLYLGSPLYLYRWLWFN